MPVLQYLQLNTNILCILLPTYVQVWLQPELTHNANITLHLHQDIHQDQLLLVPHILAQTRVLNILTQLAADLLFAYFCVELPNVPDVVDKRDGVVVDVLVYALQ